MVHPISIKILFRTADLIKPGNYGLKAWLRGTSKPAKFGFNLPTILSAKTASANLHIASLQGAYRV